MADIPEYKPPKADSAPKGSRSTTPRGSAAKKGKRTPPKPTVPVDQLREELTEFFVGIGVMTMMRNPTDGIIIVGGAPEVVDAWCDLAGKNPYVHMFLQKLCAGSDTGKVVTSTLSLALAIASNHGAYNGPMFVSPEGYAKKAEKVLADRDVEPPDEDDIESVNTNGTGVVVS